MISFFRRALSSWLVLGLLALVMLAFVVTGVTDPGLGTGAVAGGDETIATIGRRKIGAAEVEQRVQAAYRQAQQENSGLALAQFVAGGGFDRVVQEIVAGATLDTFGRARGLAASKRMVDGEIAGIPAFRGPTGQFDENAMRAVLAQQRIGEGQLRDDIAADAVRRQLLVAVTAGARAPTELVTPYASLLLETRAGLIGEVPAAAFAGGAAPSEAELGRWYAANRVSYVVPERRVLRYALVSPEQVAAAAQPTEAEIVAAYRADAARYMATERRDFTQAIADSEAKARALAAAVRGGQAFEAAARAAGLSPVPLAGRTKAAVAELASAAVADAAFGAAQGAVSVPARSAFGWHVVRVDRIVSEPGRTLPQARDEIAARLRAEKAKDALADLAGRIDDGISDGNSLEEVARAQRLTLAATPALLRSGLAPGQAGWTTPAELQPVLAQAFGMSADDDPVVATVTPGERFAVVQVAQVLPAAAPPLTEVRARVAADFATERAQRRAKAVADAIAARVNAGAALPAAFAGAPVRLPRPQPAGGRRADLGRDGRPIPAPLQTLFTMAPGEARVLEQPGRAGWWLVRLERVAPGDARGAPAIVEATRRQFAQVIGEEYAQQFAGAARGAIGVPVDQAAINRLRTRMLAGGGAQ